MAIAALVVERRAALHELDERGAVEEAADRHRREHLLGEVDDGAAVAVGHALEGLARIRIDRKRAALLALGAAEQRLERGIIETREHEHGGARQERAVELEGGVLGGGADERDRAVLHAGGSCPAGRG